MNSHTPRAHDGYLTLCTNNNYTLEYLGSCRLKQNIFALIIQQMMFYGK